jgi:hypothetical protein
MPDKEQLRLEVRAAKESWLQALQAAGLASRARHDAAEAARLQAEASRQALLRDLRSAGLAAMLRLHRHAERVAAEYAARLVAEQATARAAASQAARAELASMRSAAQSEATALNEAEITYLTTQVQSLAARMTRFHAYRRARLSLKRQLRYGALGCTCSHATVYDNATDIGDEDVRQALARGHANGLSLRASQDANQKLLASEQHQQESWRRESPSTDALYEYVAQLADSWLHELALPSDATVRATTQLQEKWQAHANTARLGHNRCTLLRQQLMLNEEPAAVETELCEVAAEQQRSAQVGKRTEPAAGAEAQGRWPTPDPDRSTDVTVSHQ